MKQTNGKKNYFALKLGMGLFALFLLLSLVSPAKKKILYLNSYHLQYITFNTSKQALDETFASDDFVLDVEFLDSKQFGPEIYEESILRRINTRLRNRGSYDMVLTSDDNALRFVLKNHVNLFGKAPVVFWGLNDLELGRELDNDSLVTGVVEKTSIKKTIEFIRQLQPEVKEVIAYRDSTISGDKDIKIFRALKDSINGLVFSEFNISKYTIAEIEENLKTVPSNAALLKLSSAVCKDRVVNPGELSRLFGKVTPVPIYNLHVHELGLGYVGGYLIDYYGHALQACKMAKEIINGASPSEFKVVFNPPGKYMVDRKVLNRFGLNINRLPKDTELINTPSDEFYIRKDVFIIILGFLIVTLIVLGINTRLVFSKRRLEKRLMTSQENYETLFRDNHSISLIIDPLTGYIIDANNTALKYYGYSLQEIKKLNMTDINALPETDVKERMYQAQKALRQGFVFAHRKKNGEVKDVEVFSGLVHLNDKPYLHSIVVDITDRLKAERQIIEAKQKAEESDNLKSAFLANMSHEIRTPMNSILGFSDLLMKEEIPSEKRNEFVRLIYSNGEHLLTLINDIIDISKIEANQLKVIKKECHINKLMDQLYTEFENQRVNENKQFRLLIDKGTDKPDYKIITDCTRLKQVLINLLSNAFKFTEEGEIEFGYKIREDGMLQFYVKDSGIGIPRSKHEVVFSVFQRVEDSFTKNYDGSGLGLSITKSLIEKLGGQIWLMSEPSEGSRFYFTIPGADEQLNM